MYMHGLGKSGVEMGGVWRLVEGIGDLWIMMDGTDPRTWIRINYSTLHDCKSYSRPPY